MVSGIKTNEEVLSVYKQLKNDRKLKGLKIKMKMKGIKKRKMMKILIQ